ncbi:amidase family protein [Leptolyngbya sp. GB1-A1]|uniref:amidase family protein n=1 Tax=Leptolyngbya sp. GB1-A1 TaxID=2933908 RepID=UPI003298CFA9
MITTTRLSAPTSFKLIEATIEEITKAFEFEALTAEQLVQLYLNRIEAYDQQGPTLNSMISVNPSALETARQLDEERRSGTLKGPLHGIPIVLKDNFDTFDLPTTAGSIVLKDSVPPDDARSVELLREDGAIILGKANMREFAARGGLGVYTEYGGETRNPYNFNRNASGSSGGTGAAIAANFAVLGTGSDTGGSIRGPSSFNGLVGIRPTRGLIPLDGIVPFALSRDGIGPMARTVTDAAVALGSMVQYDPNDPIFKTPIPAPQAQPDKFFEDYTQFLKPDALKGARIGVGRVWFGGDPEVDRLIDEAIQVMEDLGATIVELDLSNELLTTMINASRSIGLAEFPSQLAEYLSTLEEGYPKTLDDIIAIAESPEFADLVPPSRLQGLKNIRDYGGLENLEYIDVVQNVIPALRETFFDIYESNDIDTIVFPTTRTFASPFEGVTDPTFVEVLPAPPIRGVEIASLLGFSDITVPAGLSEDGLPITISFTGVPYSEPALLGLAYSFEQATQHRAAPPLLPALEGEEFEYVTEVLVAGDAADDVIVAKQITDFDGNGDTVFSGDGNDSIDTTPALTGRNRLYAGNGADKVLASRNDQVFGEAGADILDASKGRGDNLLYGGLNNDELFAGTRDQLFGDEGDDKLYVGELGDNLLTGGTGADQFWIAKAKLPVSKNTIADYEIGADVIGISDLSLCFTDLSFSQVGQNTDIRVGDAVVATLLNTETDALTANNFVFV